jgi:hypothetical protein
MFFDEEMTIAGECSLEDLEEYPEWQRESIETAIDVEENWENYISLPDKNDIDEYREEAMRNFVIEWCKDNNII